MRSKATKTDPIQYQIANYIKDRTKSYKHNFNEDTLIDICYVIFKNFRIVNNKPIGLRLTPIGNNFMRKWFSNHTFELDAPLVGSVLVQLDKAMLRPYYLTKTSVVFYDDKDAAWFKLGGSNLKQFSSSL